MNLTQIQNAIREEQIRLTRETMESDDIDQLKRALACAINLNKAQKVLDKVIAEYVPFTTEPRAMPPAVVSAIKTNANNRIEPRAARDEAFPDFSKKS